MKHLEPYISRLKSHGYKVTHQRLVVLDYLQRSREHPSAEVIYSDLKERYPTISLATIYNTLEMLTKVGLVLDLGARKNAAGLTVFRPNTPISFVPTAG